VISGVSLLPLDPPRVEVVPSEWTSGDWRLLRLLDLLPGQVDDPSSTVRLVASTLASRVEGEELRVVELRRLDETAESR
jgi:hypothetical protein